ncbi:MAG: DNA replication/repair protein RecF [Gammaproteobacteria bacterium]|nr:DNA replication/repair protein RecF [Gammaproteobacteria bacterium]
MWLQQLQAQGLRSFTECQLSFSPGINVLYGDNGVGKTSILEGINVLSCGKSFRTSKVSDIVSNGKSELVLFGEVSDQQDLIQLGVQFGHGIKELRINRGKVSKWAHLAKILPVLDIHPESYLLITGGPVERRKYLNWGMFHVEPNYAQVWSDYTKALKQRNFCLKTRNIKQARHWHQCMAKNGQNISVALKKYSVDIAPYIDGLLDRFGFPESIDLKYYPGWDLDYSLEALLDDELQTSELPLSTQNGPHRGDLKIYWQGRLFSKSSSRGQQKVLAIALKLAQAQLLQQRYGKSSIYLIDELPAELDKHRREVALEILAQLDSQVIISAVSKDSMSCLGKQLKWFHVEHGCVSAVV